MYFWSSLDVRGIINVFLQDKVIKCSININALMCKMLVIHKDYKIIQQNQRNTVYLYVYEGFVFGIRESMHVAGRGLGNERFFRTGMLY